jgi:hypothetical protein
MPYRHLKQEKFLVLTVTKHNHTGMLKNFVHLIGFFLLALFQISTAFGQQEESQNIADTSIMEKPWQHVLLQQRSVLPYKLTLTKIQGDLIQENINKNPKATAKYSDKLQGIRSEYQKDSSKLANFLSMEFLLKKRGEDSVLRAYVDQHTDLKAQYAAVFPTLDSLYRQANYYSKPELWLSTVYPASSLLRIGAAINKFKRSLKLQSQENKVTFYNAHVEELKDELTEAYANFDVETERQILRSLITEAARLAPYQRILAIQKIAAKSTASKEPINRFVNDIFELSRLKDPGYVLNRLIKSPGLLANYNDALLLFEIDLNNQFTALQEASKQREEEFKEYLIRYIQLQKRFAAETQNQ